MLFEPMFVKTFVCSDHSDTVKKYIPAIQTIPCAGEFVQAALSRFAEDYGCMVRIYHEDSFPDFDGIPDFPTLNDEGFVILCSGREISFIYIKEIALYWAICTAREMLDGALRLSDDACHIIADCPDRGVRGYRIYLPARAHFDEFFRMIDVLTELRLNSVILEIGGAMEYDRHPEINEAWRKFALDMHSHSGRCHEVQFGYGWEKNSIHVDNAEGDILTKAEIRTLIDYIENRGMRVIPEVPLLSHSDYICLAHPELRERKEDPYPDTYCPSDPRSYDIAFDILDEVMEVFDSEYIHIGHDEYYTSGLCEKCRDTDPAELYANDIKRLHDYLAVHGRRTIMWGEKLLEAYLPNGHPIGGTGVPGRIPRLWQCRDMLPRDITMLHWYWSFGDHHDSVYHDRGYPVVFGNFEPYLCENYRARVNNGINGGFVSNWGSFGVMHMQRNLQYIALIFAAAAFWSHTYDTPDRDKMYRRALQWSNELWRRSLKNPLTICQTTDAYIKHKFFYDGVFALDEECLLGWYVLEYADGTIEKLPVRYGFNIANDGTHDGFCRDVTSPDYDEVSHAAIPLEESRCADGRIWYSAVFENPRPYEKPIKMSFEYSEIEKRIGKYTVYGIIK